MEWVEIREGVEVDLEDRLENVDIRANRRRGRNDDRRNDNSNSVSGNADEDDQDIADMYYGLNEKKLWEKVDKAENFDSFCADVERRIHFMLLVSDNDISNAYQNSNIHTKQQGTSGI